MYYRIRNSVILDGPSVGVGAGIAIVSILAAFFLFNMAGTMPEQAQPQQILTPIEIPKAEPASFSLSIFTENASPVLGNPDAPVTLVEFGDYQCFFCNKFFHETEAKLFQNYVDNGKVKMIFKDFTIIGPDSVTAAHGTHCANEQGKFWEYHDILYENWTGENNGWASSDNLLRMAQEIDLNIEEWSECMTESRYQQIVASSTSDAKKLGITGTPGFFVIGPDFTVTKISGAQPYEVFERIIESELSK